jgi:hypothetical protein
MAIDTIQCPHCGKRIPLNKALTDQIEESLRKELKQEGQEREKELREEFEELLRSEQKKATAKAKKELGGELLEARDELEEARKKLETANKNERSLLRKQKELQEKQAALELEVDRRVASEREIIVKMVSEQAAEKHRLKDQEREKKIADFSLQIDDLKRKLEQNSQQLQGEVAELDLEALLRGAFPHDAIEPVAKGVRGGDIIWTIRTPQGADCGQVVWESKNTKNWSDSWLAKAKDDQRAQKAACVAIVSSVLPKGLQHFGQIEGVWVCSASVVLGVAVALRSQIVQVAGARLAADGKDSKVEHLYDYLTGTEFRQRVETLVDAFVAMKEDLDRERRSIETGWARREKQIGRALTSLSGMYGEMQGIVGQTLQRVATLELPAGDGALAIREAQTDTAVEGDETP